MSIPKRPTRTAFVAAGLLLLALVSTVSAYSPAPIPSGPQSVTAKKFGGGGATGGPPLARPTVVTHP